MPLEIEGFEENAAAVEEYIAALQEQLNTRIAEVVNEAYNSMVDESPVDTGFLQGSWQITGPDDTGFEITNDCDYVGFVEYGHATRGGGGFVSGENWITPAYEQMRSDLESVVQEFSTA